MPRGKSKNAKTWEKILMVLVNGGEITKEQIESTTGYGHMYRLSTELWKIKIRNGVIRTVKDGRKVVGYELVNIDEMKKLLATRGFSALPLAKKSSITKLNDLNAKPAKSKKDKTASTDEIVVEEVKETV